MGVARGLSLGFVALVVGAAVVGGQGPASFAQVASLLVAGAVSVGFGERWPRVTTGFAAAALAPSLVAVLHGGGPAGWGVLAGAVGLLALRQGALPATVPWAVLAVGVVEAGRSLAAAETLGLAAVAGAPLVLAGLGAAGAAALPASPRFIGGALLLGSGLAAATRWNAGAAGAMAAARRSAVGLPPALGAGLPERLAFLALRPTAHTVAIEIAAEHGVQLPLSAGWSPLGAPLLPEQRIAAAAWLERHGRGGEGRRLLQAGSADPEVAWWWVLARRMERLDVDAAPAMRAPASAGVLPGRLPIGETLLTNGVRTWLLDTSQPCRLGLEARGESWQGAAEVVVTVDGRPSERFQLAEDDRLWALGELEPGPHRVRLQFDNDAAGPDGDRNVHLGALGCASP